MVTTSDRKSSEKHSAAIPALMLFVLICLIAPCKLDWLCKPSKIEVNVQQLKQSTVKPDIVLLGSSYVFWPMCHLISSREPDMEIVFKPDALDSMTPVKRMKIFNLSYSYQNISDDYIWVNQFLVEGNKPSCVVLGCAPRDFQCSDYSSPVLTNNYISTADYQCIPEYVSMIKPSFNDLISSIISKSVPLYHKRARIKEKMATAANSCLTALGFSTEKAKPPHPNIWTQTRNEIWNASLKEYRYHYSLLSSKQEQLQFSFLEKLLQRCKERNIRALVVNMPVRIENLDLLPPGYYAQYCQQLQRKTEDNQGDFIDLNKELSLEQSDFDDTIHLNARGGKKLFSAIFGYLQNHVLQTANSGTIVLPR